jgi:hypothetical protein
MKIELKSLKHYEALSDETNAFSANLYVDGKLAATCKDDGCGGEIEFYPVDRELLTKAENYCKTLPDVTFPRAGGGEFSLEMTLELFVGEIVEKSLREIGMKKFRKRMEKDFQKSICFGTDTEYRTVTWKNQTVTQMLTHPMGIVTIQKKVDELKQRGETILNTNLTGIIL